MAPRRDAMLLLLTWAAGNVDALSYLGLGHVFTAMMTGNTVLLGLALGQGHVLAALRSILALLGFAAGVGLGALVAGDGAADGDAWPASVTTALALEAALLGAFTVTWELSGAARSDTVVHVLIGLCSVAMGVQSAAVRRLGVPGIATTYITGTMTSLMVDLIAWLRHTARRPLVAAGGEAASTIRWEQRVGVLAAVFAVYGLGAFTGTILHERAALATLPPLAAVAAVTVVQRLTSPQTT